MTSEPPIRPYHYWKFREAVDILAGADAPLRKRLQWALLQMGSLLERDLPEPVRSAFLELNAQATWKQDGDPNEGTYANTLAAMSDEDAGRAAKQIVKLFELSIDPDALYAD